MNNVDVPSRPYPREIMDWTETVFKPVFENEVLTSKATFALRENDYILDDLKIGGNAQTIIKDRWVHHTSFLWDYEASNMEFLLMPKKRPKYREDRDHKSFLDKIKRHIPTVIDFENLIVDELSKKYEVKVIDSDEAEALRLGLIPSAKDVRTKVI
jgi:lipoate-protein ligase A